MSVAELGRWLAPRTFWVRALISWSVVLWVSRLRNVLADDGLSNGGLAVRVGIVVLFVGLALAAEWGARRGDLRLLAVLVVWTIGFWLVRGIGMLVDDHTVGFKVVHTVLMVVSIGLAWLAAASLGGFGVLQRAFADEKSPTASAATPAARPDRG